MKQQPLDPVAGLPEAVQQVIEAARSADSDPLGSYTGVLPESPWEVPIQDADDL